MDFGEGLRCENLNSHPALVQHSKINHTNPNVLVGALVGGSDCQDKFMDQRDNYMQTEACTYNTAPLIGVFVKLLH